MDANIKLLIGKTIKSIVVAEDNREVRFYCTDESSYLMYHSQDCCEDVWLDDVIGDDLQSLVGSEIQIAEVRTNNDPEIKPKKEDAYIDSVTWTFYELGSHSGRVTLRWCGTSNGYYSEEVDFVQTKTPTESN